MSTNAAAAPTLSKADDGYDVTLDGNVVGRVRKIRERTPMMTNDGGANYAYAHSVCTRWTWSGPGVNRYRLSARTRRDAVDALVRDVTEQGAR